MKIWVLFSVGRQVDGEIQMTRLEKAFQDKSVAEAYTKNIAEKYEELIENVKFICQRQIIETELT